MSIGIELEGVNFPALFIVLIALNAPYMIAGIVLVIKERNTYPIRGRSLPHLVLIGLIQFASSTSYALREVALIHCNFVLMIHVNFVFIIINAFNIRLFRLWFLYYYAQEKLAMHRERSRMSVAARHRPSVGSSHSRSAFEHSLISSELSRPRFVAPHRVESSEGADATHDENASHDTAGIVNTETPTTSHNESCRRFAPPSRRPDAHGPPDQEKPRGSAVPAPLSPKLTFSQRLMIEGSFRLQSSTWFHERRYLAKRITLSIAMLAITFPCVLITSVFYLTRENVDVNALDGSCTALGDARAVANVLTALCIFTLMFGAYKLRNVTDGYHVKTELKYVAALFLVLFPFTVTHAQQINPTPPFSVISFIIWVLFIVLFALTFYFPLYIAMKQKRTIKSLESSRTWDDGKLESFPERRTPIKPRLQLSTILGNQRYRTLRRDFELALAREFCVENIMAWQSIHDLDRGNDDPTDVELAECALDVYRKFLRNNAPFQVNITQAALEEVETELAAKLVDFERRATCTLSCEERGFASKKRYPAPEEHSTGTRDRRTNSSCPLFRSSDFKDDKCGVSSPTESSGVPSACASPELLPLSDPDSNYHTLSIEIGADKIDDANTMTLHLPTLPLGSGADHKAKPHERHQALARFSLDAFRGAKSEIFELLQGTFGRWQRQATIDQP